MSAELKRELGFWDLILFHVSAIVGLRWLAVAAAAGYASITLWLLAFIFFFLPQTFVVLRLSRKWPVEGGLYEWTKQAFGPFHGFVSGWCYWANNIVYYPTLLTSAAGFATYLIEPGNPQALENNGRYIFWFSLISLWLIIGLNMVGLRIGKWVQNIGAIATWIPAGIVIILGVLYMGRFGSATPFHARAILPDWNLEVIGTFSALCFAVAGFELVTLMGGEIKNPEVNIPRSIPVAGAIATLIYILGTLALIVSVPMEKISIISGVLQAMDEQGKAFGLIILSTVIALPLTLSQFGGVGAWLAGSGRILFVVGVDRYLPAAFSKVHPKWGTPYVSILTQGILSTLFLILSFTGATVKQVYQTLIDFNVIVYFIPYLYLFLSYFRFMRRKDFPFEGSGIFASFAGFLSTLLAILLSFRPPDANVWRHEAKMIGGTVLMVGSGLILYYIREYRKRPPKIGRVHAS
jgi:amino acid transporter